MKLSREWLSEFTDINASDKQYADAMTLSGSKVEGWEITGEEISGVVVGRVLEITRHENSDHMWVCKLDAGSGEPVTIVTGAQNVRAGDLVPAALDGARLPGGIEITTSALRGIMSQGMLCSLKELGLDLHDYPYAVEDGIFILQEDCSPGDDIKSVLGFGDTVVEFEITNNRPDCFSVIGLARESAATFGAELKLHEPQLKGDMSLEEMFFGGDSVDEKVRQSHSNNIDNLLKVEIIAKDLCPRYTARMVKNIKIEPSPAWMRRRLRNSGVRPINNIVDITNYVMLEYGQPMHAFDYSCVKGGKIVVRRAREGDTLETLDGKTRAISADTLVIADISDPIGLAGVMGGGNSEITDATNTIVFESANFNGVSIRKTAIALGMRTDASGRYEKGLDPNNTLPAVMRACELVELLGAGEVVSGTIDVVAAQPEQRIIKLEPERINALLGTDIDRAFMVQTLNKLQFVLDGDDIYVPSFRPDVESYADIAEEVARFYGYNRIEASLFSGKAYPGGYSPKQQYERRVSELIRGLGFFEVLTYSFGSKSAWDKLRLPDGAPERNAFVILKPLGEDTSVMRTTALASMLEVLGTNLAKRNSEVRLFELATVYRPQEGNELADERVVLTLGAYGSMDFYGLKGCVEALLAELRIADPRFEAESNNAAYHPGRCARIYSGSTLLGVLGQIHPAVAPEFGLDKESYAAELELPALMASSSFEASYKPLPRYPAITRDIALVCDESVTVAALSRVMLESGGERLESVRLFDVYTGTGIPQGKRSVAFSLTLRAADRTLTDEAADKLVKNVLEAVEKVHGAVIR
jgi:phenylalanyl-tRNA synthetase beta chain